LADEFAQTGTILSVEEKHLTRKSDNQPFTLYKIRTDSLGELSTTDQALFNQARALEGSGVLLTYTEKPGNDGYPPNRYLKRINLSAQGAQTAMPVAQGAQAPAAPLQATDQPQFQNVPIGRDEAIWRQTATKTAASFNNKDLAEYWDRVSMLMAFYRTGVIPGAVEGKDPEPAQEGLMPSQNTFVPPAPGDFAVNSAISDEDIPF